MNRKLHLSCIAAIGFTMACIAVTPAQAANKDSVPDWVRDAAKQTLPIYSPTTRAVILLEDMTYTVAPDGQAVEHLRKVIKILRPNGREAGIVGVPYDKDTKILSMHVWSIGPDGHEYALKDNEMIDVGSFDGISLYSDDKVRAANPPGRDPGGVVAYEYERKARPYLAETTWFFQGELPRLHQSFTLVLPPGFTFGTVWAHHDEVKAIDLEHQNWRWQMDNVPRIDTEEIPLAPSDEALAGRMTVHYGGPNLSLMTTGTWQSIGQWYDTLAHDRLTATPEIAAKAAELTAGKPDFYDKAEAIGQFVQKDVRYVEIKVGIGGLQPHAAADVFRNRYGDCKDKSTLLTAMLSTVGIHAALVMVDTDRGVVVADAPSTVGDHVVTAIEVPKDYQSDKLHGIITANTGKRYLIFDPTWELTPFGQFEHELQGGYGVLMEGKDSQVIALPVLNPSLNTISRSAHFQLTADGQLQGKVVVSRFGDVSDRWRNLYTATDQKKQQDAMNDFLHQDITAFTIKDLKVENAGSLNKDLTTTFDLEAQSFGKSMGGLMMVRPRVLGTERFPTDMKHRSLPIDLRETMQAKDDYEIDLPAGYTVDELPPAVNLDLGFASYTSTTEQKGNTLHYTRTYTVREVSLPASKYADVQRLASTIIADEQSSAVLKKQ